MTPHLQQLFEQVHKQYDQIEAEILAHVGCSTINFTPVLDKVHNAELILEEIQDWVLTHSWNQEQIAWLMDQHARVQERVDRINSTDWVGQLTI